MIKKIKYPTNAGCRGNIKDRNSGMWEGVMQKQNQGRACQGRA